MWRTVFKFTGAGDDGVGFDLVVLSEFAPGVDGGPATPTRRAEVRTADGQPVTVTGRGIFQVDRTRLVIRSDVPAAGVLADLLRNR